MVSPSERFERRRRRVRKVLKTNNTGRVRLSVHRTGRHIYGQIIDDAAGRTLVAVSSLDKDVKADHKLGADKDAAKRVGVVLAERAKAAGITTVVFDRGGFQYHGRVQALAEGAREGGLEL